MEFKCCEDVRDTLEVEANYPSINNTVFLKIVEGTFGGDSTSLALSPEDAVKLAEELIRLAGGKDGT